MPNDILMGIKSIVWGLSCSLLWHCDPQPSLSTWQCNTRDGSVWKDGVIVEASRPCNWGLSEDSAPRSATCPAAETLASIEKQEVSRKNLQVVVVQHEEDISWSDPFAAVRTVCKKSGRLGGVPPQLATSPRLGWGRRLARTCRLAFLARWPATLPPFCPHLPDAARTCLMRPAPA